MFDLSIESDQLLEIRELIWSHRDETESNRRIAQPVIDRLVKDNAFRLTLEPKYNGNPNGPAEWLAVFEALASCEAAVAWVCWNNALACSFSRFVKPEIRDRIYGNGDHLHANSSRPEGVATEVDGGYKVSGRWTLVSGCELAEWFALRCVIEKTQPDQDKKPPALRFVYIHRSDVKVIDTWDVGGLKGTGSHDIEIKDVYVEQDMTFAFEDQSLIEGPSGNIPVCSVNSAGCASISLGIAFAALENLKQLGHTKISNTPRPSFRDHLHVQSQTAKLSTEISGVRYALYQSVGKLWSNAQNQVPSDDKDLAAVWAASVHGASVARRVVSETYALIGTEAIYSSSPVERAHRDIHAVLQHGTIQPHWLAEAGRVLMGLAPNSPVFRI